MPGKYGKPQSLSVQQSCERHSGLSCFPWVIRSTEFFRGHGHCGDKVALGRGLQLFDPVLRLQCTGAIGVFHADEQSGRRMSARVPSAFPAGMRSVACRNIGRYAGVNAAVDAFDQIKEPRAML